MSELENNNILPMPDDGDVQMAERNAVFLPEDDWEDTDISGDWLNPEDEWETAKNAMYIGDAPVCTLGGVTILTGQSGNGKTMTIAMMIAAAFKREYGQLQLGSDIENPVVLYVDTEMEKYNTQRLMNRVYYICGWAFKTIHPEFRILRLRDTVNVQTRWKKVLKAIDEVRPTFCILDGLIDLVEDFNDNVECQKLVYKLMAGASWYDMSVVGVIHQNPGGEKMAGHLGSFGERKAVTTLSTKKDKNGNDVLFVVEQKKARDKDADNIKFRVNDDNLHIGIPEPCDSEEATNSERKYGIDETNALYDALINIIPPPHSANWTDIRDSLKKTLHIGTTKAGAYIEYAQEIGMLHKPINGRYCMNGDYIP